MSRTFRTLVLAAALFASSFGIAAQAPSALHQPAGSVTHVAKPQLKNQARTTLWT
jgi:hypothetical protein